MIRHIQLIKTEYFPQAVEYVITIKVVDVISIYDRKESVRSFIGLGTWRDVNTLSKAEKDIAEFLDETVERYRTMKKVEKWRNGTLA